MSKLLAALILAVLAIGLSGCGSSDNTTEAPPKGPAPKTESAPPGTPGPQERTLGKTQVGDPGADK